MFLILVLRYDYGMAKSKIVFESNLPSNKSFGIFFTLIFFFIGSFFIYKSSYILTVISISFACIFFIITILRSDLLLPLNKLWMTFGLLLGKVVSPIILGIIFFGLFTPLGVFMRIIGRDELRLKQKDRSSFWKIKNATTIASQTFKQQF
jgi:hypothetical protein